MNLKCRKPHKRYTTPLVLSSHGLSFHNHNLWLRKNQEPHFLKLNSSKIP